MTNNVNTISEGVKSLNNLFFDDEIWSIEGLEWKNMNKKDRGLFVKTLLSYKDIEINDDLTQENDDLNDDNIIKDIDEDLDKTTEETEIGEPTTEQSEGVSIQDQFVRYWTKEKNQLIKNLEFVNRILKEEPVVEDNVVQGTKTDIVREWFRVNPNGSRKDFMAQLNELGSKAMLSTYYYKFK